jgi:hypothetical protein
MTKEELTIEMDEYAKKAYALMEEIPRDKCGNPLTLEGAIRAIILKNPTMASYRDDALETLYCLLGSGIRWLHGRLGDSSPNNYMNMPPSAGGQGCWSHDFGVSESLIKIFGDNIDSMKSFEQVMLEGNIADFQKIKGCIDDIDYRCKTSKPRERRSWYPISWYACHICAPKDAQEDFKNGALETIHLILDTEGEYGTKDWLRLQETKKYAQEMLDALKMAK